MSETVFAAMHKSRSPEEFVKRFLLPGLRTMRLPSARSVWQGIGRRPAAGLDELMNRLKGRGVYDRLVFVNQANPRAICLFRLERTQYLGEDKTRRPYSDPLLRLFDKIHIRTDLGDYYRAVAAAGGKKRRSETGPIVFHAVLIPHELLDHDEWSSRLQAPLSSAQPGGARVLLDSETFNALMEETNKIGFLQDFLATVRYLNEETDEQEYRRALKLSKKFYVQYPKYSTYQLFFIASARHRNLMRSIVSASSKEEIKKLLKDNLKASDAQARFFADLISSAFSKRERGGFTAQKISEDSQKRPHFIRGR